MKLIPEYQVHSAYLDSDGSLHLYDKDENHLEGWPVFWPEEIRSVGLFLQSRGINYVNAPRKKTMLERLVDLHESKSGPATKKMDSLKDKTPLEHKISEYLQVGGLFNPELMEHNKVRDMIMECRDMLAIQRERIESLEQGQNKIAGIANKMERQRDESRADASRLAMLLEDPLRIGGCDRPPNGWCEDAQKALREHEALKSN